MGGGGGLRIFLWKIRFLIMFPSAVGRIKRKERFWRFLEKQTMGTD